MERRITPLNAIVLHAPKARSAPVITVHTTAEVEATREAMVLQECQEEEVSLEEVVDSGEVGKKTVINQVIDSLECEALATGELMR